MSEINFLRAARQNDVLEIGVETLSVGRTSITLGCAVSEKESRELILAIDKIVFVALNSRGRPIVHRLARKESRLPESILAGAVWQRWLKFRQPEADIT